VADNARIVELRRRVQADPASIAFAQLAEECRRSGDTQEAISICRAGLAFHPDYLSARVTLGRALVELGRLDEAHAELSLVLVQAPDNLPANRAIAEMYQTRGQLSEALVHYKRALELAKYDPDLEHQVERIANVVSPPPPAPPKVDTVPTAVEDLFDFDTLLAQLGGRTQPKEHRAPEVPRVASELDAVLLTPDDNDPFSLLERQLRDTEQPRAYASVPVGGSDEGERQRDQRVMAELEEWLAAIVSDRDQRLSA
jgi:tetratricopeptide (TPR) repeat protein